MSERSERAAGAARGSRGPASDGVGGVRGRSPSDEEVADVAQLAERVLGKDEVTSSILVIGSILRSRMQAKDAHHSSLKGERATVAP